MNVHRLQIATDRVKHLCWVIIRSILIIGLSFVILYPILQKLSVAFKDPVDLYNLNVIWIPEHFTLINIKSMINVLDYWPTLLNTVILCVTVTVAQTAVCSIAGYSFAKLRFKGSEILFVCAIFTILIPPQTLMVPLYIKFRDFDVFGIIGLITGKGGLYLLDSYWPLIISSITGMGLKSGLFIYIFRQFFRGLPKELEESAYVDGSGIGRTFMTIVLPNAKPAIITVLLFTFVWQWNDTFFTNMYMGNSETLLANKLSIMEPWIYHMLTGATTLINADPFHVSILKDVAVLLMISPLIIFYLFVQKNFVESVERTGLVG